MPRGFVCLPHISSSANGCAARGTCGLGRAFKTASANAFRKAFLAAHPVLLAEDGKIIGVCGETEIIRALAVGRLP